LGCEAHPCDKRGRSPSAVANQRASPSRPTALDDTVLLLTIVAAIVVGLWLLWRPIHGYEARGRHGSVAPGAKDPTAVAELT
jgi:hypothetical protein